MPNRKLAGKVAIITGGATGIGREIALLYADEGACVLIGDVRLDEGKATVDDIRERGGDAHFVLTDVRDSQDLQSLVREADDRFGHLDIATANAGILGRGAGESLSDISEEDFLEVIDVNFGGVWRLFKYAVPALERAGGGTLTATSSVSATMGFPRLEAYCASKAALGGLIRALALDLAPRIRVNAVAPGAVDTEIAIHTLEAKGISLESTSVPALPTTYPRAQAREIAHAHLFLASSESSFVTGQTIVADGGWSITPAGMERSTGALGQA